MQISFVSLFTLGALLYACSGKSDSSCISSVGNVNLSIDSCTEKDGISISVFFDHGVRSVGTTDLDNLKVGVAVSDDRISLEEFSGMQAQQGVESSSLITIPEKSAISTKSSLSANAMRKLERKGWITKADVIVYRNQESGKDDFTLVCGTSLGRVGKAYVAVAQCSPFYPEDIKRLQSILEYIEKHSLER